MLYLVKVEHLKDRIMDPVEYEKIKKTQLKSKITKM